MNREVCEHFNTINQCSRCDNTMKFNIDKTFNIDAEIENHNKSKVAHLWDENGNCTQDKLTLQRWVNIKTAIEFMLKDSKAIDCKTECGLSVYRGWV